MIKVDGVAKSDSKPLVWGQRTKCPGVEFQVAGAAVETQARTEEMQSLKPAVRK